MLTGLKEQNPIVPGDKSSYLVIWHDGMERRMYLPIDPSQAKVIAGSIFPNMDDVKDDKKQDTDAGMIKGPKPKVEEELQSRLYGQVQRMGNQTVELMSVIRELYKWGGPVLGLPAASIPDGIERGETALNSIDIILDARDEWNKGLCNFLKILKENL